MVDTVQKITKFPACLITVGTFCQSVKVRSYVLPPLDSAVPSKSGDNIMETYLASIPDAQRALGIGRSTAYRLMDAGKLEKVKIGRRALIKVASIRALAGEDQHPKKGDLE